MSTGDAIREVTAKVQKQVDSGRRSAMISVEDVLEIGRDLRIAKIGRQAARAGTWVRGTLDGHRFDALVFPEHAECPEYELGHSRISKLWVQRLADRETVVNFDRGWDVRPTNELARRIAGFLEAGLAEHVFGA